MKKISGYAKRLDVVVDEQIVDTSSSIVETIVDFAYRNNVDFIVTGSRGLNVFRTGPTGSLSQGILNEARSTVMVVK
jgi:nucleotide-binding universal stress UspA family protein